jgi:hypothetical protein
VRVNPASNRYDNVTRPAGGATFQATTPRATSTSDADGHASLETTQRYTRATINDLRVMHAKFHPREQQSED